MSSPIIGVIAVAPRAIAVVRRYMHHYPALDRRRPDERALVAYVETLPGSLPLAAMAKRVRGVARAILIDDPDANELTEPLEHMVACDVSTAEGLAISRFFATAGIENDPIVVEGDVHGADERGTIVPPTELIATLVSGAHDGTVTFERRGELSDIRAAVLGASPDLAMTGTIGAIAIAVWVAQTIARSVFEYRPRFGAR